jgi:hypothetical protein
MVQTVHGKMLYYVQLPTFKKLLTAMRLTTILLLAGCLQVSAQGGAQTITLSLKNAPLERAFRAIEKQTDYRFVYTQEDIAKAKHVNLQVNNGSLAEVLGLCFKDQPITYILDNKHILINSRQERKHRIIQDGEDLAININGHVVKENSKSVYEAMLGISKKEELLVSNAKSGFVVGKIEHSRLILMAHLKRSDTGNTISMKSNIGISDFAKNPTDAQDGFPFTVFFQLLNIFNGFTTIVTKLRLRNKQLYLCLLKYAIRKCISLGCCWLVALLASIDAAAGLNSNQQGVFHHCHLAFSVYELVIFCTVIVRNGGIRALGEKKSIVARLLAESWNLAWAIYGAC